MSKRTLNKAAPALLAAAKMAVRALMEQGPITEDERQRLIHKLVLAIDAAEVDKDIAAITLVVTHATASALDEMIAGCYDQSEVAKKLRRNIIRGTRETKQRVYISLDTDVPMLTWLRNVLNKPVSPATRRAFDRLVEQIDIQVLRKSPLQMLAETGY